MDLFEFGVKTYVRDTPRSLQAKSCREQTCLGTHEYLFIRWFQEASPFPKKLPQLNRPGASDAAIFEVSATDAPYVVTTISGESFNPPPPVDHTNREGTRETGQAPQTFRILKIMTENYKRKVSVIIPVYNAASYLRQSIESALSQSETEIEIIVVDDGSNDGSQEIARSYSQVYLIEQDRQGACRARNVGLANATAEFIKFLDADDYLEPDILQKQIIISVQSGDRDIVFSDIRFFNDDTGSSVIREVEMDLSDDQVVQLFKSNIQTSAPLHRRELLSEIGGFDERFAKAQEYNLHIRLAMNSCRFIRLPGVGAHVRDHLAPHRISNQSSDENYALRKKIYIDLLHSHYGGAIPKNLRHYFMSNAFEAALMQIRCGNIMGGRRELGQMILSDASALDLIVVIAGTLSRICKKKFHI